jgi:hypothetical protein
MHTNKTLEQMHLFCLMHLSNQLTISRDGTPISEPTVRRWIDEAMNSVPSEHFHRPERRFLWRDGVFGERRITSLMDGVPVFFAAATTENSLARRNKSR